MTQDRALQASRPKRLSTSSLVGQQRIRGRLAVFTGARVGTSVTGWMMMALKSGELAGLDVPPATYRKIARWLTVRQQSKSEPHLYRYNPYVPDGLIRHGRVTSKTMTAVGRSMRLYTGWRRDNSNMTGGAAYLSENLPANGTASTAARHLLLVLRDAGDGPRGGRWLAKLDGPTAPAAGEFTSSPGAADRQLGSVRTD